MKKVYKISLVVILAFISCNKEKENKKPSLTKPAQEQKSVPSHESDTDKNNTKSSSNNFSWDQIEMSDADAGVFPFIKPPAGMMIDETESKEMKFDRLEFFNGTNFFIVEGRVKRMSIEMKDDQEWQDYFFEKSMDDYLLSLGAQKIFSGQLSQEQLNQWGDLPNEKYEHMHKFYAADVVNHPVSFYVLKTQDQQIGFQVSSNSKSIGIVENENFKQTIEKVTAESIYNDIYDKGLATVYINFDTGKSRVKAGSYAVINEIAKMMKANKELKIRIEGHTDNVGNEAANLKLSENRAKAVLLSLTDEGIEEERLESKGYGASAPIVSNETDNGKAQNRRVELRKI